MACSVMLSCEWSPGSAAPIGLPFLHGWRAWVSWQTIRIIDTVRAAILKWFVVPIFLFTGLHHCFYYPSPETSGEASQKSFGKVKIFGETTDFTDGIDRKSGCKPILRCVDDAVTAPFVVRRNVVAELSQRCSNSWQFCSRFPARGRAL